MLLRRESKVRGLVGLAVMATASTLMALPTPICALSRASLLTGQNGHSHGALTLERRRSATSWRSTTRATLPVWLQRRG